MELLSLEEDNETLTGIIAFAAFNAEDGSTGEEITITESTATITVVDDDGENTVTPPTDLPTVSISADVASIPEGNEGDTTTVTYTITTSEPLERDARVIIESTGGNTPLLSEPLDILAGEQTVTFTNEVSGDSLEEDNETLTGMIAFAAFNAEDGSTGEEITITESTATITVVDDDGETATPPTDLPVVSISADPTSFPEGNEGDTETPLLYTISLDQAVEREVLVSLEFNRTGNGQNISFEGINVAIPAGELSTVYESGTVSGDNVPEEDENTTLTITQATFNDATGGEINIADPGSSATITVIDDDGESTTPPADLPVVSISAEPTSIPEGDEGDTTTVTYTITTSEPLERDARVIIDSTGGNNPLVNEPLDILAGEQTVTFTNEVSGDSLEENNETLTGIVSFAAFNAEDGSTGEEIAIAQPTATIIVVDDDGENTTPTTPPENVGEPEPGDNAVGDPVFRFFNPTAGVHFYTASEVERDSVLELPNYDFEGESYNTVDPLTGGAEDVYRFFNSNTGVHLYTTSEVERDSIIDNLEEFSFEGTAFNAFETQVEGSLPVYRFFEPTIGVHFYTPNEAERSAVDANLPNYNFEGIAYYAFPLAEATV